MDTKRFDEKNLAKHKERCDMIEQLALMEEENRKLGIRANNLEQRLESETRKAERRKRHIDLIGAVLTERRNQLHRRNERIAELEKQVSDLRAELVNAKVLTERERLTDRERQILAMWPRFEDGKPVMIGDAVANLSGAITVEAIEFSRGMVCVKDAEDGDWCTSIRALHPLKRPAPNVLDADGVEIKVGDTVHEVGTGREFTVERLPNPDAYQGIMLRHPNGGSTSLDASRLTHIAPDSWELLEKDAVKDACEYAETVCKPGSIATYTCCGCRFDGDGDGPTCEKQMALDLIRRAKALAGVEAGE